MGMPSSTSSSNLTQIILKLIVFTVILWLLSSGVYFALNHMYFKSYGGNSGAQINHVMRTKYEAYIFGASRASHHYDPTLVNQILGLDCFNAGDDGKSATYQLGLLQMLLVNHIPQRILYEVGDITMSDSGTTDLFPYYYRNKDIRVLLNKRDKWAKLKFMLPLYTYNRKLFSISKGYVLKSPSFETGYRPIYGEMHVGEIKKWEQKTVESEVSESINNIALESLRQFVGICNDREIELIFCFSPSYLPKDPGGLEYIEEIADNNGIPIFLYGKDVEFNYHPELFKDAGHLNHKGADLFTRKFCEDIKRYVVSEAKQEE